MDAEEERALEAAGFKFGDFADFLGMDDVERQQVAFRADLGAAIRRLRESLGQTQKDFGASIGFAQPKVARVEIGAPEVSLDLMLRAFFGAGGRLDYAFQSAPAARPEVEITSEARPGTVAANSGTDSIDSRKIGVRRIPASFSRSIKEAKNAAERSRPAAKRPGEKKPAKHRPEKAIVHRAAAEMVRRRKEDETVIAGMERDKSTGSRKAAKSKKGISE